MTAQALLPAAAGILAEAMSPTLVIALLGAATLGVATYFQPQLCTRTERVPPVALSTGEEQPVVTDFDRFYRTHCKPLTAQLFAYLGDLPTAQDLVQEAFCRALARWAQVSTFSDPVAWVRRVAWNLAVSNWRRTQTAARFLRRHREEHVPAPGLDRVVLAAAMTTLPPPHRRVVFLHYLADLPVRTIARQEHLAEGTVKSWLHRSRQTLATALADHSS